MQRWHSILIALIILTLTACGASPPDGGDGYKTAKERTINIGSTVDGKLDLVFTADNWTFTGATGQTITIRVEGEGDIDPRVKLLDSAGAIIAEDDDSAENGKDALIMISLPSDGSYIVRIDLWNPGAYSLSITEEE